MPGLNAIRELGVVGMPDELFVGAPPLLLGIGKRLADKLGIFDILCIVLLLLGGEFVLLLVLELLPLLIVLLFVCTTEEWLDLFAKLRTCCWNV